MVTPQVEQFARQSYFDALAEVFVAPDNADTIARLEDAFRATVALAAEVGVGYQDLEAALENPAPTPEELAQEADTLFETGEMPIPLYESAWTDDKAAAEACRKAYESADLSLTGDFGMPYDHVTLQFAFLSVLVLKGKEREADNFFAIHPARWIPQLAKALMNHPDAKHFRTVGCALAMIASIEHWRRQDRQ